MNTNFAWKTEKVKQKAIFDYIRCAVETLVSVTQPWHVLFPISIFIDQTPFPIDIHVYMSQTKHLYAFGGFESPSPDSFLFSSLIDFGWIDVSRVDVW